MEGSAVTTTRASRVTMKYATDVSSTVTTRPAGVGAAGRSGRRALRARSNIRSVLRYGRRDASACRSVNRPGLAGILGEIGRPVRWPDGFGTGDGGFPDAEVRGDDGVA